MKESTNSKVEDSEEEEEFDMGPIALSSPTTQEFGNASNKDDQQISETKFQALQNKVAVILTKILVTIREKFVGIKRVVQDQWLQHYGCVDNSAVTRSYQVWPGNNVFFFHGRLICGPDPRGFLLTTVSIILSSWIFAVYREDDLQQDSSLIVVFSLILTITVLFNLFLISTIDPGIIPRNDQSSIEEFGTTRRKKVTVNGVELKLKFCRICKIYRPPRSCHCAICNNCVEKFDHHCPWIGQCIAMRNYRFYLTFVVSALILFTYVFLFSCWRINQRMKRTGTGLVGILKICPETLALVSFSFAAMWFLGGLIIFHAYLIAINKTAYENFRQSYMGSRNPFDRGLLGNIMEVLLAPLPPSRVDFRAEVMLRR